MKKIKISSLEHGMSFDQPIFVDPRRIVVEARQKITNEGIASLLREGILEVETNGNLITKEFTEKISQASKPYLVGNEYSVAQENIELQNNYRHFCSQIPSVNKILEKIDHTLFRNFDALIHGKIYENHTVIQAVSRLVNMATSIPLLPILFQYGNLKFSRMMFHALHSACYGILLGKSMGYNRFRLQDLACSMILMDIGMWLIPETVREKKEALSEGERKKIQEHPIIGNKILINTAKHKASIADLSLEHHEAFDGSGYPNQKREYEISEFARIALVCDSYTAMNEKRSWRTQFSPFEAIKIMLSKDVKRFDPQILRNFVGVVLFYPIGSLVRLNTGLIGMVIGCKEGQIQQPFLRLLRQASGEPFQALKFLDLSKHDDLEIAGTVFPPSLIHFQGDKEI